MIRELVFAAILLVTLGFFTYTIHRLIAYFRLTRPGFRIDNPGRRLILMFRVAFGQTKIFRRPVVGLMHALVFWGFCVIIFGSIEMVVDGLAGLERSLSFLGILYDIIMASGDVFALIVAFMILAFLFRRVFLHIRRFEGIEMKRISHLDANIALTLILLLMVTLLGMNTGYLLYASSLSEHIVGFYPVSDILAGFFRAEDAGRIYIYYQLFWWSHILLIFLFANILPYSKHFHVFMSVPNVFLSRLEPLGKLDNMENVMREVMLMMQPDSQPSSQSGEQATERFGVRDVEDVRWKNYFDSLSCTECGRCTSVCPANMTGKKLSPRKIMMDVRARMKEKGPGMRLHGRNWTDQRSLLRDYITEEELWACTTCNACALECPVNINQPSVIVDMRRYLVMEEGSAPGGIKSVFSNIENNGAPWQYSAEDRMLWAKDLEFEVPVMAEVTARGVLPEYLFWVGCAGAFDDRYKKVIRAFARILHHTGVSYAVLGREETCTGDPARRAGNEMLFQMQAFRNISTFSGYKIQKIITTCPHCYNIFLNEYPELGGKYEVIHYAIFLQNLISSGQLKPETSVLREMRITYHDPCYLGRANGIYDEPRDLIKMTTRHFVEMPRSKSYALCCGAGGSQMFKEAEKGDKEVFMERTEEALSVSPQIIATSCPFCMTMLTDGLKYKNSEQSMKNLDIAELIAETIK